MRANQSFFFAVLGAFASMSSVARAQDSCEWDSVNGNVSGFCDGVIGSDVEADDFEISTIDDDHVIEDMWTDQDASP
jgi:hypothetical protein